MTFALPKLTPRQATLVAAAIAERGLSGNVKLSDHLIPLTYFFVPMLLNPTIPAFPMPLEKPVSQQSYFYDWYNA